MKYDTSTGNDMPAKAPAAYLFCDVCAFYPMEPVHGHFMCQSCHAITKCCEMGPMTLEATS